jgi:hypothetical protein
LLGTLLAANAARVVARDPSLRVPPRAVPAQAALVVALPVVKAAWWLFGLNRTRSLGRS